MYTMRKEVPKTKSTAHKKGFTLIEVVVTMAVLGVLIVSMLAFLSSSFTNSFRAGSRSQAAGLAQEKMEELRAHSYEGLLELAANLQGDFSCPAIVFIEQKEVEGFPGFNQRHSLTCCILEIEGLEIKGFKIEVEVSCEKSGISSSFTSFVSSKDY